MWMKGIVDYEGEPNYGATSLLKSGQRGGVFDVEETLIHFVGKNGRKYGETVSPDGYVLNREAPNIFRAAGSMGIHLIVWTVNPVAISNLDFLLRNASVNPETIDEWIIGPNNCVDGWYKKDIRIVNRNLWSLFAVEDHQDETPHWFWPEGRVIYLEHEGDLMESFVEGLRRYNGNGRRH